MTAIRFPTSADVRKAQRLAAVMEPMSASGLAKMLDMLGAVWTEIPDAKPRFATSVWGRWETNVNFTGSGKVRVVLSLIERPGAGELRWYVESPGLPIGFPFKQDVCPPAALTQGLERAKWPATLVGIAARPSADRSH